MSSFTKLFVLLIGLSLVLPSCVSKKKFVELENEKNDLSKNLMDTKNDLQSQIDDLKSMNDDLQEEKAKLNSDLSATKADFESRISDIQTELNMKEKTLNNVQETMSSSFASIEKAVSESNAKIKELSGYLYLDVDPAVKYRSGSTRLSTEDKDGLKEIADMLIANPEMTIVIEGHTDTKKLVEGAAYKDNWDLSVARATQVVRALEKMGVSPSQMIAAGRGEHMPAVTDDPESSETLKANRRTEFMVLPNIGKLYNVAKGN